MPLEVFFMELLLEFLIKFLVEFLQLFLKRSLYDEVDYFLPPTLDYSDWYSRKFEVWARHTFNKGISSVA